jgi:hypothetical protein
VASEFRRREIAHDDVGLSYLDNDGDGPVIVALHGLAGTGDAHLDATAEWAAVLTRAHRSAQASGLEGTP